MHMIYSPDSHIPILMVYMADDGVVHLVIKRANRGQTEDMTLDQFLGLVYRAVA